MTIQEKSPRERAAMAFKSAGLGERSAVEAARMLFETGVSFESAAVMGQRLGDASTATPASIREAARRWDLARSGPRTQTAWGRPVQEDAPARGPSVSAPVSEAPSAAPPGQRAHTTGRVKVVGGVRMEEVEWFEPVISTESIAEQEKPTRSAWGRKLED